MMLPEAQAYSLPCDRHFRIPVGSWDCASHFDLGRRWWQRAGQRRQTFCCSFDPICRLSAENTNNVLLQIPTTTNTVNCISGKGWVSGRGSSEEWCVVFVKLATSREKNLANMWGQRIGRTAWVALSKFCWFFLILCHGRIRGSKVRRRRMVWLLV